jgi:hypothetical protein
VTKLIDRLRRHRSVKHRVTVRANRHKVLHRIDDIFAPHLSQRDNVMNMNVPLTDGPVSFLERETADATAISEMIQARSARLRATLVCIDRHRTDGAFRDRRTGLDLLR